MKQLSDLINSDVAGADFLAKHGSMNIAGITANSNDVQPDYIFVAVPGTTQNGWDFIPQAIRKGASLIIAPSHVSLPAKNRHAILLHHDNPKQFLSQLAAIFFERQPSHIAAVTGTNGKSSVVHFCQQLWNAMQKPCASLGTVGLHHNATETIEAPGAGKLTTLDPSTLHQTLANLDAHHIEYLALEASSHGLDQYRLDGLTLSAAAFTNFTQDHLDYHHTMEAYFDAKARLFEALLPSKGTAVLNSDMSKFTDIAMRCRKRKQRIVTFGTHTPTSHESDLHVQLVHSEVKLGTISATVSINGQTCPFTLSLTGDFQLSNALCAVCLVASTTGEPIDSILAYTNSLKEPPGRMQKIFDYPTNGAVFVDYAHTPDALQQTLVTLRPFVQNRLFVVFGCGGDRDTEKRPLMGKVASSLAEVSFITDDNPRSEAPQAIRKDIISGCEKNQNSIIELGDRKTAIQTAIKELKEGDILLIAGKGHEKFQIIGEKTIPFDDADIALHAIQDNVEIRQLKQQSDRTLNV